MRPTPSALVACLAFLAVAAPARGAAPGPSAARDTLEKARAELAGAVKRIEKDPPSTEDLEAAHVAVGKLKDAIDAGARHEPEDLEYAKAALAARKELRTNRDYVEDRRAKVHIHTYRRSIDAALATLGERAGKTEAKDASAQDFQEARAAAAAVKKLVGESKQFAPQDEKFASYLGETEATLARHEKAFDERWVAQMAGKQAGQLAERRRALTSAMGALGKGASDAQFQAADQALSGLNSCLDEGKPLEAKDKAYRADAERARAEAAQARKKMDDLWSETGVERLKAEIEPAHKDLAAAGRSIKSRKATSDQLAEARTAAIVVRKLVEKFAPEASRSQAFGQYVAEVKKTLAEVEGELQKRTLDLARSELNQALRKVDRRGAEEADFAAGEAAAGALEKVLATAQKTDADMVKLIVDSKQMVHDARAMVAKRRLELELQRQRAKVEEARKVAVGPMGQIQRPDAGDAQIQEAEKAVQQIQAALDEGAPLTKKDREYAVYANEVRKHVAEMQGQLGRRKLALAGATGKAWLVEQLAGTRAKLSTARQPAASDAEIEAAAKSLEGLLKGMEERAELEGQDRAYATQAEKTRDELGTLKKGLELARQARELRKRTVEALAAGNSAAGSAAASKDVRAQKAQYDRALEQLKSCESAGTAMLEGNKELAGVTVLVEGRPSSPKEVVALCAQRTKEVQAQSKQAEGLVGFEDGPKKAYEKGKALAAQGKKDEAVAQFKECISSGMILQHWHPELKDQKLDVGGSSLTLTELIKQCTAQRDAPGK